MISLAGRFHQSLTQSESSPLRNGALTGASPWSAGSADAMEVMSESSRKIQCFEFMIWEQVMGWQGNSVAFRWARSGNQDSFGNMRKRESSSSCGFHKDRTGKAIDEIRCRTVRESITASMVKRRRVSGADLVAVRHLDRTPWPSGGRQDRLSDARAALGNGFLDFLTRTRPDVKP